MLTVCVECCVTCVLIVVLQCYMCVDCCVAVLQRVLRRRATGNLLDSVDSNAVVKGWVTKVSTAQICWGREG